MISLTFNKYPPLCVVPSQTAVFLYLHSQVHLLLLQRVPLGFLLLLFVTMYVFQLKSTMQVTVPLDHGAPWPRSIGSSFICSQIVRVCSSTPWPLIRHLFLNSIPVSSASPLISCISILLFGVTWSDLVKLISLFFPWGFFSVATLDV